MIGLSMHLYRTQYTRTQTTGLSVPVEKIVPETYVNAIRGVTFT